ncbi:transposase [Marinagarivorans algicola]|uniref:transposase n=2 Tax=Marinagarivorans algicola TaxID=1513270 RepID=UPI0037361143
MTDLVNTIFSLMPSINKPQRVFMAGLFATLVVFHGRATFRNMSRYSGMSEKRFSRWSRRDFPFSKFNTELLLHSLGRTQTNIAAIDASFMKKSGNKTEGLGWFYNGAQGASEKGLETSLISVVNIKSHTAYSIDARQTIDTEGKTRTDLYAVHVVDVAEELKRLDIQYLAADSFYSKFKFVNSVVSTGLHMVGKLRVDANLKWLYQEEYSGCGRAKKYDGKINFENDLSRFQYITSGENNTEIYSAIVYSVSLKREIRVVMIRSSDSVASTRAILFSTDINLEALTLLSYYKARFQIEFLFRDAKQHTGLTHCQSRCSEAIDNQVNASLTTLNLLKIEDRNQKQTTGKTVISIASWKRRKSNQHLLSRVFDRLGLSLKSIKVCNVYEELSDYGLIAS